MIRRAALSMVLVLLPWPTVEAGHVYRWIDEQGQIQYADRPPSGEPSQSYLQPVPPSVEERIEKAELEAWRKRVSEYEKLRAQMREARAHEEAEEALRRRYCEDAYAHLVYFSYPGRQYVRPGPSGDWTNVDAEERAALIEHWQKRVDELCK